MGGDNLFEEEEPQLLMQPHLPHFFLQLSTTTTRDVPTAKMEDGNLEGDDGMVFERDEEDSTLKNSLKTQPIDYETRRKDRVYKKILKSYREKESQIEHLEEAKTCIMSYRPGLWIEYFSGMKLSDYDVPTTTTLLLVGPQGSGKSSLVNRISRVFDDDKYACDRAQVSHYNSAGGGTHFAQEYMILKGATSFCLYDTRSLSEYSSENMEMLKRYMTKGVRHGEMVVRYSDSISSMTEMKYKDRHSGYRYSETRAVNFVIFVVDGLSVLRSMKGDNKAKLNMEMVAKTFNYPFLSFRDDKPVVVMTHGDLLSKSNRARVRLHLGELLGVPPMTQIFDIPENNDKVTAFEIVGMLRYCLEHGDRNLQEKEVVSRKMVKGLKTTCLLVLFALLFLIGITAAHFKRNDSPNNFRKSPPISVPTLNTILDWRWRLWLAE